MLQQGPLSSGQIAAKFDMAWPSVTGHLAALKDAALVETERHGNVVHYRLNISAAEEALGFLLAIVQGKPAEHPSTPSPQRRLETHERTT